MKAPAHIMLNDEVMCGAKLKGLDPTGRQVCPACAEAVTEYAKALWYDAHHRVALEREAICKWLDAQVRAHVDETRVAPIPQRLYLHHTNIAKELNAAAQDIRSGAHNADLRGREGA